MKSNFDRNLNIFILIMCVVLGLLVAYFSTSVQANFFHELGVSRLAAFTIEPTLILVSFLLGIKISKVHKTIAFGFLCVLFLVSFISIVSMYSKKSFTIIEKNKVNQTLLSKSGKSEEIIADTIDRLSKRDDVSSKNIVKAIDQLQKQQTKAEVRADEVSELKSIIDIISTLLTMQEKNAILLFAVLIALSAVFAPSFLFFSAGMMIRNLGFIENKFENWNDLSLKQKIIMLAKDKVGNNIEDIAKFLHTDEGVIKAQLSRIGKKIDLDDIKIDNGEEGVQL